MLVFRAVFTSKGKNVFCLGDLDLLREMGKECVCPTRLVLAPHWGGSMPQCRFQLIHQQLF